MAEQSPTENGSVQSSSDHQNDESLLDQDTNQSADEQAQDTVSGEDNSSDSDSGSSSPKKQDDQSSDDDGLSKFAKSQGFDPENLTDGERKALKIAHDNQKAYRQESQRKSDDLRKATDEINDPNQFADDEDMSEREKREAARDLEIAQLKSAQRARDFFDENNEAREYKDDMAKLILDKKEKYGVAAARLFAQDLEEVYILAKARRGGDDSEAAREAGRREERELLRKRQEGGSDTAHSTTTSTSKSKITREWLNTEYNPGNPEHRQMLDEALARGDLNG